MSQAARITRLAYIYWKYYNIKFCSLSLKLNTYLFVGPYALAAAMGRRIGHPYQNRTPPKRKKPRTSFSRLQVKNLPWSCGLTRQYLCNGWKVWSNGTTSVPKSVPRLLVDKVRIIHICGFWLQFLCSIKVPNKSLSQELNNVLFLGFVLFSLWGN